MQDAVVRAVGELVVPVIRQPSVGSDEQPVQAEQDSRRVPFKPITKQVSTR
jgi:hypothetical protein